jgi:hypothetical protein
VPIASNSDPFTRVAIRTLDRSHEGPRPEQELLLGLRQTKRLPSELGPVGLFSPLQHLECATRLHKVNHKKSDALSFHRHGPLGLKTLRCQLDRTRVA